MLKAAGKRTGQYLARREGCRDPEQEERLGEAAAGTVLHAERQMSSKRLQREGVLSLKPGPFFLGKLIPGKRQL